MEKISSLLSRLFFVAAIILLFIAIWSGLAKFFGYYLPWISYTPGQLLGFASILLLFVIAILARQIRDEIKNRLPKRE